MRLTGHVARMGERRAVYRVLLGEHEEKRPHGRPKLRRENNIKIDVQELGWGTWAGLIWLRTGTVSVHF